MKPNIHILFDFKEGAWGGGNQFLKALRLYFKSIDCYTDNVYESNCVLFNSFPFNSEQYFKTVFDLKHKNKIILVHRVDGPIFIARGKDLQIDKLIFLFNQFAADGTIFQSHWTQNECYNLGLMKNLNETVITNAPDPNIFYPRTNINFNNSSKIKLIATSWSNNPRKGFDIYKFLDENLDFDKYEMTFVGQSPISFNFIKQIAPQPSYKIAELLRDHHIFLTASKNESCSNSLLEALHCGLPVVVRDAGGNLEVMGNAGLSFSDSNDVMQAIDEVSKNYEYYKLQIKVDNINTIGSKYLKFICDVQNNSNEKSTNFKYFRLLEYSRLKYTLVILNTIQNFNKFLNLAILTLKKIFKC